MSSWTPCGYCGADPTTSTVFGPTNAPIASTSAVQSARTGALRTVRPKLCAALWNAAWADSARTISGSVMPRSCAARSRAARTPHRMDSVPPLVRNPATSASPWSRLAVHPTVSDWMRRSDGNAWVLSAFSCRNIAAAASATACTDGPPSYTSPNVLPSLPAHVTGPQGREFVDHVVDRSAILPQRIHAHPVWPRDAERGGHHLPSRSCSSPISASSPSPSKERRTTTCWPSRMRAEYLGFDAFFRSDHYLAMGGGSGAPGPTDAWITLAGLARDTSTIRLGTLVSSATFRLPGPFAVDRRPGRPDVRRPGRARPRRRLVRRRTPGLRNPVPGTRRALRPARGATRDHHRHVGDAGRRRRSTHPAATTRSRVRRRCPSHARRRCRS